MKRLIFSFLVFGFGQIFSTCSLDQLAIKYGTDKSSSHHDYTFIYDKYFNSIKFDEINFLEIGLAYSWSALMWEEYFQKASLYFIDITPEFIKRGEYLLSNRSKCYLVDQENTVALNDFVNKTGNIKFDIIIDDGGHTMKQQITSFVELFPQVKSGGVYVIEDLHTSYYKECGGYGSLELPKAGEGTTIRFLQNLIDDVNFVGARTMCANFYRCPDEIRKLLNYYQSNIQSMHFYDSMCFIFKR